MSGLTRWGFDRKAGGPKRPVPLVRSCGEIRKVREANRLAARALAVSAACDRILTGRAEPNDRAVIEDWKVRRAVKPKEAAAESTVVALPVPKPKKKAGRSTETTLRPAGIKSGATVKKQDPVEAAPPKQASAPVAVMAALPLAVSTRPAPARAPIEPQEPEDRHPRAGVREYFPDTSKAREIRPPAAPIDWGRVANAVASRRVVAPARKPKPRFPALSKEPCRRCGVPGSRGCDHQLPYEEFA